MGAFYSKSVKMATQISKKRKFVADGVFRAELNEFFTRELAEDGYSGVELYAEKVATRGLCAIAQAESLRYKLIGGLAVRRACYGVAFHHGERSRGLRGCSFRQAPWSACQGHEVRGRTHDPLR